MTRRVFVGTMTALGLSAADDPWVELFDGHSLNGWRPSENAGSWKVVDGTLSADGPRSHLFYTGLVRSAAFRNFELEVEVMTRPLCNSGVYFHTAWQETGFPRKGFEVQIANSYQGEGGYRERKKGGSLYGVRNIYKQLVPDEQWFKLNVLVRGKSVQIRQNGVLLVDYVEPTPPVIPDGAETGRFLDQGTFALQCHNDGSKARFRSVRVRPLPDDMPTPGGPPPVADDVFKQIINTGRHNIPMVDFHVHLKSGLTLEQALAKSRRDGIQYGIAVNCGKGFPIENDDGARQFADSMKGQPIFALFDYIFTDSMTWTDNRGKRMRLWMPNEVGAIADPQEFMDTLVERTVGILEREPIDIYVNPTFLPDALAKDYERLWTDERRKKVIDAAVKNGVAMELNNRYRLPSASFVKMAKAAGCKFTFGTNNTGPEDLGRCEYGLQMVDECKLVWQDFFVPLTGPKAVERKGAALRA